MEVAHLAMLVTLETRSVRRLSLLNVSEERYGNETCSQTVE